MPTTDVNATTYKLKFSELWQRMGAQAALEIFGWKNPSLKDMSPQNLAELYYAQKNPQGRQEIIDYINAYAEWTTMTTEGILNVLTKILRRELNISPIEGSDCDKSMLVFTLINALANRAVERGMSTDAFGSASREIFRTLLLLRMNHESIADMIEDLFQSDEKNGKDADRYLRKIEDRIAENIITCQSSAKPLDIKDECKLRLWKNHIGACMCLLEESIVNSSFPRDYTTIPDGLLKDLEGFFSSLCAKNYELWAYIYQGVLKFSSRHNELPTRIFRKLFELCSNDPEQLIWLYRHTSDSLSDCRKNIVERLASIREESELASEKS